MESASPPPPPPPHHQVASEITSLNASQDHFSHSGSDLAQHQLQQHSGFLSSQSASYSQMHSNNASYTPSLSGSHSPTQSHAQSAAYDALHIPQASLEIALRGEIKKLREENSELRRRAARLKQLENEVEFLRNVSLLQHEEKLPIRLRELEHDNMKLRRMNASLHDKVKHFESEEHRQRLIDHHNFVAQSRGGFAWGDGGQSGGGGSSMLGGRGGSGAENAGGGKVKSSLERMDELSAENASSPGSKANRVLVIRQQGDSCDGCKLKLKAVERTHEKEKTQLQDKIDHLQTQLGKANGELEAINLWVQSVVSSYNQYPALAQHQPHVIPASNSNNQSSNAFPSTGPPPFTAEATPSRQRQQHDGSVGGGGGGGGAGLQRPWSSEVSPHPSYLLGQR